MSNCNINNIISVIDYIENHLTEKLNLDIIAEAIYYSKYHLHHIFTDSIGFTIHDYIQRRQLTEAAKLLIFSNRSILDIALISGYKSQQAFTNIFTSIYKISPKRYRENGNFYPLQLRFDFEGSYSMLNSKRDINWNITCATESDIPCWIDLVRLVIDGFPNLQEFEYIQILKQKIKAKQALILKDNEIAIGIMLFSYKTGSIDFMGTHPLYKNRGIQKAFLDKVINEFIKGEKVSITTYREGDKADIGHRKEIKNLGFIEAELLVEYGYPTQKFVLHPEED